MMPPPMVPTAPSMLPNRLPELFCDAACCCACVASCVFSALVAPDSPWLTADWPPVMPLAIWFIELIGAPAVLTAPA